MTNRITAHAPLAILASLLVALAGCTAGTKDGAKGLGEEDSLPVLYLNVTVDGQTYRYSTDQLGGGSGGNGSASGTVSGSVSSGTGSVQGNATSGNSTAQGNATAGPGTATATGTYNNASAGDGGGRGGMGGVPSGDAPLDVRVEIGASNLPEDLPIDWTFEWGDAAATSGNGTSANATGSPGAAPQQARETGSSLPATLQHTFTQAGQYQMAFGLKVAQQGGDAAKDLKDAGGDGKGKATGDAHHGGAAQAVRTLRAAVHVQGDLPSGGPEPGSFLGNQTDTFGGSALASAPPICGVLDTFEWKLNETFGSHASEVQRVVIVAAANSTAGDVTLTLIDQNGTEVASGSSIDKEGTFPPGAYAIEVEACPAANLEYTVTAMGQHFARSVP